ncbi:MAG: glycosyltransferase, partial [Chloroflexota bacterium]
MITNHGLHHWDVVPGLPDTGGQNVFVNDMSQALADLGHQVTIVNRGGFPDPMTGQARQGVLENGDNQRIIYLDDGLPEFVRKEDMAERIPFLTPALDLALEDSAPVELIISHYWDGAALGVEFNKTLGKPVTHIWIPHSLGVIKKENLPQDQWEGLRLDERLENEKALLTELDGVGSTSALISDKLRNDYDYAGRLLFLPPCVDQERYFAREVGRDDEIWHFLSQHSGLLPEEIRGSKIVSEISRTAITKRKDVLLKAFALVLQRLPNAFLVATIDEEQT